jgi:hypothetical protein
MAKKSPAQLQREIDEAIAKAQLKKKALIAEYNALKRALKDPALSNADAQELEKKLTALDAELVALNTAEYSGFLSKPRPGGY